MRTDRMPLTGYLAQWRGHRNDAINEPKEALHGIAHRAYELFLPVPARTDTTSTTGSGQNENYEEEYL